MNTDRPLNLIRSKNGSTLIWALIMMLVLGILITGGLAMAQSYSQRSITQHTEKQAYYTALSATKAIAEWLDGTVIGSTSSNSTELKSRTDFINNLTETPATIDLSSTFDINNMGECKTTINKKDGIITITSNATYNGEDAGVTVKLEKTTVEESTVTEEWIEINPAEVDNEATDPDEVAQSNTDSFIKRTITYDLSVSSSQQLLNKRTPSISYDDQYYGLNIVNGDGNKIAYLKLNNGNFPYSFLWGISTVNRPMIIYTDGGGTGVNDSSHSVTTLGGPYKQFVIYTSSVPSNTGSLSYSSSNELKQLYPPLRDIVISPRLDSSQTALSTSFSGYKASTYNNMIVYIDDVSNTSGFYAGKLVFEKGLTLGGDSAVYTRRNTDVSLKYTNHTNNNTSFTLNGKLVVADNTTTFNDGAILNGTATIQKTSTSFAKLILKNQSQVNGNIVVDEGGILTLESGANIVGNIYIKPGGKLEISGVPTIRGDVYVNNAETGTSGEIELENGAKPVLALKSDGSPSNVYIQGNMDISEEKTMIPATLTMYNNRSTGFNCGTDSNNPTGKVHILLRSDSGFTTSGANSFYPNSNGYLVKVNGVNSGDDQIRTHSTGNTIEAYDYPCNDFKSSTSKDTWAIKEYLRK